MLYSLYSYLMAGYPFFGAFSRINEYYEVNKHMVVVRAVSGKLNVFSVMNPSPNITDYEYGTISSGNAWTFTSATSDDPYHLIAYGYPKL